MTIGRILIFQQMFGSFQSHWKAFEKKFVFRDFVKLSHFGRVSTVENKKMNYQDDWKIRKFPSHRLNESLFFRFLTHVRKFYESSLRVSNFEFGAKNQKWFLKIKDNATQWLQRLPDIRRNKKWLKAWKLSCDLQKKTFEGMSVS